MNIEDLIFDDLMFKKIKIQMNHFICSLVEVKFNSCKIISQNFNNKFAPQYAHIHNFALMKNTPNFAIH
jgi:hypothetical protein